MTPLSARIRSATVFAFLVTLTPLAYLLIWLFGNPEIFGSANPFLGLTAWGPAFPIMNALGWYIGSNRPPDALRVVIALAAWFLVSFLVRYFVRSLWAAIAIIVVLVVFISALNFVLILPYLL